MARLDLLKFRRDTAANWTSANPTLDAGEPGFETDTGKLKIGDGSTAWGSLAYVSGGAPANAHYVTTQSESGLSAEFSLGSLSTGLLKQSVTAGVSTPANAVAKTDYWDTTVFVASGASHAIGLVPDPGASSGSTKFLREDATWAVPAGGTGLTQPQVMAITSLRI